MGRAVGVTLKLGWVYTPFLETTPLSRLSLGFALYTATGAVSFAAGPRRWLAQDLKGSRVFPSSGHTALLTVVQEC